MQSRERLLLGLVGLSFVFPQTAHAYLDPGSGSMLLQLVLGGVAGLAVLVKLYWQRLLLVFGMGQEEDPTSEDAQANQQE